MPLHTVDDFALDADSLDNMSREVDELMEQMRAEAGRAAYAISGGRQQWRSRRRACRRLDDSKHKRVCCYRCRQRESLQCSLLRWQLKPLRAHKEPTHPRPLPLSQQRLTPARARLSWPRVGTLRRLPERLQMLQMLQVTTELSRFDRVAVHVALAPPCTLTQTFSAPRLADAPERLPVSLLSLSTGSGRSKRLAMGAVFMHSMLLSRQSWRRWQHAYAMGHGEANSSAPS